MGMLVAAPMQIAMVVSLCTRAAFVPAGFLGCVTGYSTVYAGVSDDSSAYWPWKSTCGWRGPQLCVFGMGVGMRLGMAVVLTVWFSSVYRATEWQQT